MSPVAPVMVSKLFLNPPVDGERIHPSLQGLQFTPKAATLIQDIFVNKIQSECLFNRLCMHSRNEVRSQFSGLLKLVDSRVQPHIDGSPLGVDIIPMASVVATERLISLVAQQEQVYSYDHIATAAGFFMRGQFIKPAMRGKADEAFLIAACSYFSAWSAEFKEGFIPADWSPEPMSMQEYRQAWRELLDL